MSRTLLYAWFCQQLIGFGLSLAKQTARYFADNSHEMTSTTRLSHQSFDVPGDAGEVPFRLLAVHRASENRSNPITALSHPNAGPQYSCVSHRTALPTAVFNRWLHSRHCIGIVRQRSGSLNRSIPDGL